MRISRRGFTLTEVLVALGLVAAGAIYFTVQGFPIIGQSQQVIARQQARAVQTGMENWLVAQPSLAGARAAFTSVSTATAPANQVQFFSTYIAPYLDQTLSNDVIANSSSTALASTVMNQIGASMTLYWDTNFTLNHPKIVLTLPNN